MNIDGIYLFAIQWFISRFIQSMFSIINVPYTDSNIRINIYSINQTIERWSKRMFNMTDKSFV